MATEPADKRTSLAIYAALVLWTAAVAALSPPISSPAIRGIAWPQVIVAASGFLGILLLSKAELPQFWNKEGALRILGIPFVTGLAFGGINVICMQALMPVDRSAAMPPFLQPFPWSIAVFSAGAVVMEAMFCLVPLPLITAGLLRLSRSRAANWPFWTAAACVVAGESFVLVQEIPSQIRVLIVFLAGLTLIQLIYFRKFGYLASLSTRLGHYAVWHIAFGLWFEGG